MNGGDTYSMIGDFRNLNCDPIGYPLYRKSTSPIPEWYADPVSPVSPCSFECWGATMNSNLQRIMDDSLDSFPTSHSRSDPDTVSSIPPARHFRQGNPNRHGLDERRVNITFEDILKNNLLEKYACDKAGCKFLQENFPVNGVLREEVFAVLMQQCLFKKLSMDVFGNFFCQHIIKQAGRIPQYSWITKEIVQNMQELCLQRYSCRVVQNAFEECPKELQKEMLQALSHLNLIRLATDINASHVIRRVIELFKPHEWIFIMKNLMGDVNDFMEVIENKYGCRIIQRAIDVTSSVLATETDESYDDLKDIMQQAMGLIIDNCERLSFNEFSNYVVQEIISSKYMATYRDEIIKQCLLCNLLSYSQEKYASHVVEKALNSAPDDLVYAMMDELFDGYIPEPTTQRTCIDILLFHQYGNYVAQRMLLICLQQITNKRCRPEMLAQYRIWTSRLEAIIDHSSQRLNNYSSGKRILGILLAFRSGKPPGTPKV